MICLFLHKSKSAHKFVRVTDNTYECINCGIRGKIHAQSRLIKVYSQFLSRPNIYCVGCEEEYRNIRIITSCNENGHAFSNLTAGSVHEVISPPSNQSISRGLWVMGVGEPVKVLYSEFEVCEK